MGFPYPEVQNEINQAKQSFIRGEIHSSGWTCSKIQDIRVVDKAYFYRVASEPCGFFACGRIIAESKKHQIRLNHSEFSALSPAYSDECYDRDYTIQSKSSVLDNYDLAITYEWYSVVDYDKTLSGKLLRAMPEFHGYKFLFRRPGQAFGDTFIPKHLELLDQLWAEHAQKMARQGYGMSTPLPALM
jgi:hypothetical protein